MKKNQLFAVGVLVVAGLLGCSTQDPKPVVEIIKINANTVTVSSGNFSKRVHETSGSATLLQSDSLFQLVFENFKTDSGPDLRVYLSATEGATDYVELGQLKSTSGRFSYSVAKNTGTKKYKYVVIWCEDFSVLFGVAELK